MILDPKNLPLDTKLLHQIIGDLISENRSLLNQLALLKAKRFGQSSEKLNQQIENLELQIEESESTLAKQDKAASTLEKKRKNPGQAKRKPLPEALPRDEQILPPEPKCPNCGNQEFRKIADDISEALDYKPASFRVLRTIRPRCACLACEQIVQAEMPEQPIAKGKATAALLAHILVQKYCHHLPFYRQSEIYQSQGIELARSTMAGWAGKASQLLSLVVAELRKELLSSSHIHGDDTVLRVLAPGAGKTKIARLWVYARDGSGYGSEAAKIICYYYSPDRKGIRPQTHLANYQGVLHADAYSGYNKLYSDQQISEAACWAHTRRKFYEVIIANNKAEIASKILQQISKIYDLEELVRGKTREARLAMRQKHTKPLLEALFKEFKYYKQHLPSKGATVKAINYALNHQSSLLRFLNDGAIEIDNNIAERAMRPIALGRKNYLFAGSDAGGETAANIYSIIATCKANKIDPYYYLSKLLSIISGYNSQKITDLLPWQLRLD